MTGSATSAAAAIKAFFMCYSPRLYKNATSVAGLGSVTNSARDYTHHNF